MLEIILICFTSPELHIRNLEIAPEMARAVSMRLLIMRRPCLAIDQPFHRVVLMQILGVCGEKLDRLGPERGDRFGGVIQVDVEAVRLVVVLHVAEDVVVDVAEEPDFGLDAPVVSGVFEGRVVVEHAAVPAAHLVVGFQGGVLHVVLFQELGAFFVEFVRDPVGCCPVFFGDDFVVALRFSEGLCSTLEFLGKGDVVEEGPWIVEFVVPVFFQLRHGRQKVFEFFVADENEESGIYSRRVGIVGCILIGSP